MIIDSYRSLSREEYFARFREIEASFQKLQKEWEKEPQEYRLGKLHLLQEKVVEYPVWLQIHTLSFCMKVGKEKESAIRLLDVIRRADTEELGEYAKLSHYWQVSFAVFTCKELECREVNLRLAGLYRELFAAFCGAFKIKRRHYTPASERNRHFIIVFSSQVLGMLHAPTKTLLDRCYVLQKDMHKKVLIINTAMQMTNKGAEPFFGLRAGVYNETLLQNRTLCYKDEIFEFYQCQNDMPNLDTIAHLAKIVIEKKPEFLLNIGGSDLCADICGMFAPEVTVSTVFSKCAVSCGEYQIVDKILTEEDRDFLRELGIQENNVKRTLFTFSFKEQKHHFTKEQLGVQEEQFTLLIVGWRLDEEVSEEFLCMLEKVCQAEKQITVVFMGKYENYTYKIQEYPGLAGHSRFLGAQEDAVAVTECMDLYINPKRNGGGSSAAEALYKGLPVVTLPVGDVAAAAGDIFCVADYGEMERQIIRLVSDKAYYDGMSQLARERAGQLMDSKNSFGGVVEEVEQEMFGESENGK